MAASPRPRGVRDLSSHLGTRLDSFTLDEPYHIVAGTSYVRTGDFRLNPEHPPLMKLWLGASMPDSFKLRPFRALNEKVEERDFTEETVFYDNDSAAAQARTRASMWTFHALLLLAFGLLIWRAAGLQWRSYCPAEVKSRNLAAYWNDLTTAQPRSIVGVFNSSMLHTLQSVAQMAVVILCKVWKKREPR